MDVIIENNRLYQKYLFNFRFFIAEKVNKEQQQHSNSQKHNFPVCKKILNSIIPRSGAKVMGKSMVSNVTFLAT